MGSTSTDAPRVNLEDIARCKDCAAYINHLCAFERTGWACSLCGCINEYAIAQNARYLGGPTARQALPELEPGTPGIHAYSNRTNSDVGEGRDELSPAVVVLLDASANDELMELFRSTLLSALEALPYGSRFGIASFVDDELVLYEPTSGGGAGVAWHIPLACCDHHHDGYHHHNHHYNDDVAEEPLVVDAIDILPLHNFLIPVNSDEHKRQVVAIIESLLGDLGTQNHRKRPLGEAIQAMLRYLSTAGPAMAGSRLALMLSGLPNCGRGSVACLNGSRLETKALETIQEPRSSKPSQPFLLDPYYPEVTAWGYPLSVLQTDQVDGQAGNHNRDHNDNREQQKVNDDRRFTLCPEILDFYKNAGAAAASLSIAIDVLAVFEMSQRDDKDVAGLNVLGDFLVDKSGGVLLFYCNDYSDLNSNSSLEECRLTQDWCKLLSQPQGHSCTLRLRCSPELKVGPCLGGRLVRDATYHDIFYVPRVHAHDTFGIELHYANQRRRTPGTSPVVIQLVLQYSSLGSSTDTDQRTHIMTAVFPLADTVPEVYSCMDAEVSAWALFNSVRDALRLSASTYSVAELREWIARHLEARRLALHGSMPNAGSGVKDVDGIVEHQYPAFHRFMHYAHALKATLSVDMAGQTLNTCFPIGAKGSLAETLPPTELATLLYPHLSCWSSPESLLKQWCRLPQGVEDGMEEKEPVMYVVDSYSAVVIYYNKSAVGTLPYPPARDSRLMSHVTALRAARRMTPSLVIAKEGDGVAEHILHRIFQATANARHGSSSTCSQNYRHER